MTAASPAIVSCPACSKRYPFKPELANKRVKCACKQQFRFPAQAGGKATLIATPAAPPQPVAGMSAENVVVSEGKGSTRRLQPAGDADAYDLADDSVSILPPAGEKPKAAAAPTAAPAAKGKCPACGGKVKSGAIICVQCGYNFKEGTKVATKTEKSGDVLAAFAGTAKARGINIADDEAQAARKARVTEIYAPIALALVGLAGMTGTYFLFSGENAVLSAVGLIFKVGVTIAISIPFLLAAIILTAKIMGTSFGPFPTALLKLAGICFFTAGVGGLMDGAIDSVTEGMGSSFITPVIHFAMFWGLSAFLFGLDFMETLVLYILSDLIPLLAGMFLLGIILSLFQ